MSAVEEADRRPTIGMTRKGALDHPFIAGAIMAVAGATFAVLRLRSVAHGALSFFVIAGHRFVTGRPATAHLVITSPGGYDGQFYFRLGISPWVLAHRAFGITMDSGFRFQRIGYPLLSWLGSLGQIRWLAGAMIAVNIVGLGALAFFSAMWSQSFGQHALWGLLPAGYFGFLDTLARDLTEITAAAFLVAGIVAYRRHQPIASGCLLAGAILTRETAGIVVLALAIDQGLVAIRRRSWPGAEILAWTLPIGAFVVWQATVRIAGGVIPFSSDQSSNIGAPFVAMVHDIARWPQLSAVHARYEFCSLACLLIVVVLAFLSLRSSTSLRFEKIAFCLAVALMVSLSPAAWNTDTVEFRVFADVWVLGCGILLSTSWRRLIGPSAVAVVMWIATAHLMVTSI